MTMSDVHLMALKAMLATEVAAQRAATFGHLPETSNCQDFGEYVVNTTIQPDADPKAACDQVAKALIDAVRAGCTGKDITVLNPPQTDVRFDHGEYRAHAFVHIGYLWTSSK